ncbi:unnamed protein product, partial [Polarella glacialis]
VVELQTYFYLASSADDGAEDSMSSYVDVKVDFRLMSEDMTIQRATAVARAARARVLAALPGIVRDVEMNLQLPIDETESEAQSPSSSKEGARSTEGIAGYHRAQAKHVPPAS